MAQTKQTEHKDEELSTDTPGSWGSDAIADDNDDLRDNDTIDLSDRYIINDGEIDTKRFSAGPSVELSLQWWNRRVDFQVRREPSEHRVLVVDVVSTVWTVHIITASVVAFLLLLGFGLFGPLSMGAALLCMVFFILAGILFFAYERFVHGASTTMGDIRIMDTPIWEAIKAKAGSDLDASYDVRMLKFNDACKQAKKDHAARCAEIKKEAKARGEKKPDVPELVMPKKEDFVPAKIDNLPTVDGIYLEVMDMLAIDAQREYEDKLFILYESQPEELERIGRGVRTCDCQGCRVSEKLDITPQSFGTDVNANRTVFQVGVGNGFLDKLHAKRDAKRKEKIERDIKRYEDKKAAELKRHRDLERRRIAKKTVDEAQRKSKSAKPKAGAHRKPKARRSRLGILSGDNAKVRDEKAKNYDELFADTASDDKVETKGVDD